jgi:hypothetical protein
MRQYLYKVSQPRDDLMFYPSVFWHTPDWESSTTRAREGYIRDAVLYAGDFDEVNIHLFPRARTIRVRASDAGHLVLQSLRLPCRPGKSAYIFCPASRRSEVEIFKPTIYKFDRRGFTKVRNGEYVSWVPQKAISHETLTMSEAIKRWNIQACYVGDLDGLITTLAQAGIYFDEQT